METATELSVELLKQSVVLFGRIVSEELQKIRTVAELDRAYRELRRSEEISERVVAQLGLDRDEVHCFRERLSPQQREALAHFSQQEENRVYRFYREYREELMDTIGERERLERCWEESTQQRLQPKPPFMTRIWQSIVGFFN